MAERSEACHKCYYAIESGKTALEFIAQGESRRLSLYECRKKTPPWPEVMGHDFCGEFKSLDG